MEASKLRDMIYESLMTELHKKGHEDPKGRELMKGEEDLEEATATLNKKDVNYQLSIDYSGNTKPKITKLNKKGITVFYGYKVNPKDVIKSLNKLEPSIKIKHKGWSVNSSGGGTHSFIFEDKLSEDYSQRARNFRVNLRKRLEAMKPGKTVGIDKVVFKKLNNQEFTDKRGKAKFTPEEVVQAIQKGPARDLIKHNYAGSPLGAPQVDDYVKFESYVRDADTPGYFSPWSAKLEKEKFTEPDQMREGRPIFQDTPNETAYVSFKKWANKHAKELRVVLVKAMKDGRDPGTSLFLALRQVWLSWANKHAKEWSYTHSTGVAKKDFGRALAVMLKKDNLIITRSGNKLTTIGEATSLWKHFDMLQNMRMDSMDLEHDMKNLAAKLSQTHKDMEQEAEPEGGKIADKYGKDIAKLEKEYKKKKAEFKKLMAKIDKLDQL